MPGEAQTFLPGCAPRGYEALEWTPAPPAPAPARAASPSGSVQAAVVAFFRLRLRNGAPVFHMAELTEYVRARVSTAPDTAGRIMRLLQGDGHVRYELVSRAQSKYRVVDVDGAPLPHGAQH